MSGLRVVDLPVPDLRNVAEGLRLLADRIEDGEIIAESAQVITSDQHGELMIFCYGSVGTFANQIGIFELAKSYLTSLAVHS
jgi:hypothetical protein